MTWHGMALQDRRQDLHLDSTRGFGFSVYLFEQYRLCSRIICGILSRIFTSKANKDNAIRFGQSADRDRMHDGV